MATAMRGAVLVLGAEPRVAITIARCLHGHGIPVHVAGLSPEERPLRSRAIVSFFRLPPPQQAPELFAEALIAAVRRYGFDMLIPSNDTALGGLTVARDRLQGHLDGSVHLACPDPDVVNRVLDKSSTLETARQCGIAIPQTWEIDRDRLKDLEGILPFPVIVKPRSKAEGASLKVRRFDSFQELRRTVARDRTLGSRMLLQEYCPGVGVGIEVLMEQDIPLAVFQHRRLKERPASGGVSVVAVSEPVNPELAEQALCLLRRLRWTGVAMVEFRHDIRSGRAVLMEVNGRYWGSLGLSHLAGLEFPYYEWQLLHGERPMVPPYRPGIRARWTAGTLLRAQEVLRDTRDGRWSTMLETVKDLLPPTRDVMWSSRDPIPALEELWRTGIVLLRDGVKAGLRWMLPPRLRELRRRYRLLGSRDGGVYVRRAARRLLRLQRDGWDRVPAAARSILFVCHGNIIRSPMAAAMLTRLLAARNREITVASAGLHAKPYGAADPRALSVACQFGCSLQNHQAEMITAAMVEQADAIFVMDRMNEAKLLGRFPQAHGKVWLLGACEAEGRRASDSLDIVDPYDGETDDVRRCYDRLVRCVRRLADLLAANAPERTSGSAESAAQSATQATGRRTGRVAVHE
jgi:protein-tyrosine-phosphatase/predicted ATP-grasp superfamily ATP-dependent carboligase